MVTKTCLDKSSINNYNIQIINLMVIYNWFSHKNDSVTKYFTRNAVCQEKRLTDGICNVIGQYF